MTLKHMQRKIRSYIILAQHKIRIYGDFAGDIIVLGTSKIRIYEMSLGAGTLLDTLAFGADYLSVTRS